MTSIGPGAMEIRIRLKGAWRIICVAIFENAVYILHAFQKKTHKTSPADIELARKRYAEVGEER